MATLINNRPRLRDYIGSHRVLFGDADKVPAHLYFACWDELTNQKQKKVMLIAPMLMDMVYHDIKAYQEKFNPKQKEKQTMNKVFKNVQAYSNRIFKLAPHLTDTLCDGMDDLADILKEQRFYLRNVYFNLYGMIKGMTRLQIDKTIDLLVMIAFVNSAIGFSSCFTNVLADKELRVVQKGINDLIDMHWNHDCECEIKEYDINMLSRCETVLHRKIIDYIDSLEI